MKKDMNPNRPPYSADCPEEAQLGVLNALLVCPAAESEALPSLAQEECPEPGEWVWLAVGEASAEDIDRLMAHAAGCAQCAARLRRSLYLLSEDISPEDEAEIAGLATASAARQHSLASEFAATPYRVAHVKTARGYLWAGAALAASLLVVSGLSFWQHAMHSPERLMAEAYTRARIFELRVPGADFAEVTPQAHLRGGASGIGSSRLTEARTEIERKLKSQPNGRHWLQLEARADLLAENFDPAIDILDRLVAAGPLTPELLQDDASAHFERGTASGSESDRATALDELRRADELAPGDPVLLFNEAVVMEDCGQLMNAVETWNRYLRFERDPRWQTEGRHRLELLEEKLDQQKTHRSRVEYHPAAHSVLAA